MVIEYGEGFVAVHEGFRMQGSGGGVVDAACRFSGVGIARLAEAGEVARLLD